jgi:hypothetical protein
LKERHYLVFRIRPCQGEQQRKDWHNKMKACKDRLPTFDVSYNDLMDCIEHIDLVTAQQVSMLAKYQFGRRSFRTNIHLSLECRVARWFVFKPKITIWVNFVGVLLLNILVYFMTIWSILRKLEIFNGH